MRFLSAIAGSVLVSFGIVYLMSALVDSKDTDAGLKIENPEITFTRSIKDSDLNQRKRVAPNKPKKPEAPPKTPKIVTASKEKPQTDALALPNPDMSLNLKGNIPFLGGGSGNGEIMPIVRILPQMPRKAAMKGIEGYVVVKFTVTKSGTTKNISIVEANPANIFNRAAKKAILKWKYKPQYRDGVAVEIEQTVRLNFSLDEGS